MSRLVQSHTSPVSSRLVVAKELLPFRVDFDTADGAKTRHWQYTRYWLIAVVRGYWRSRKMLAETTSQPGVIFTVTQETR